MSGTESSAMSGSLRSSPRRNFPLWVLVVIVATGAVYFGGAEYQGHRVPTPEEERAKQLSEAADGLRRTQLRQVATDYLEGRITEDEMRRRSVAIPR